MESSEELRAPSPGVRSPDERRRRLPEALEESWKTIRENGPSCRARDSAFTPQPDWELQDSQDFWAECSQRSRLNSGQ